MNPHTSVSQMNTFWRCAIQYYWRYPMGLKVPPGVTLIIGKGGHKSVESNLNAKKDNGVLLPESDVLDIAAEAVNAEWDKEPPRLSPEEQTEGEKNVRGKAVDRAVLLSRLHHCKVAPDIIPTGVEREWRLEIPHLSVDLVGIIDVCEPDRIRDTKFKSKSPTAGEVDGSLQFTAYHLARKVIDGVDCKLQMDALVSTKEAKYVPMPTTRTVADHQDLLNRLCVMQEAIEKGVFLPCQRDSWACSEKWCGYFNDVCPYGRKGRERVTA